MTANPYRRRQQGFTHLLWVGLMPAGVHLGLTVLLGFEAEGSVAMLFMTAMSAWAVGAFLSKKGYGPVVSPLAAAWLPAVAAGRHWYWSLDMPSPGGCAQSFFRLLGWNDAPITPAVAVIMAAFGAAGWGFMRFDRWYEKKTGHSLFEER